MRKLLNLVRSGRMEHDLARELRYHVERRAAELMAAGLTEPEARREAALEFGGISQIQEEVRDTWLWRWLRDLIADLRYAGRTLAGSPGFLATAVLSLAMGIGATTAIFTLIDAVLLKMLPVRSPQELVMLRWTIPAGAYAWGMNSYDGSAHDENGRHVATSFSYHSYEQIRALATGRGQPLADVMGYSGIGDVNVLAGGEATLASAQVVSANYFSMLGVNPMVGRTFVESDDRRGAAPVCVISYSYWQRRFAADRSIAGKVIAINGAEATIIGVTPPQFFGLQPGSSMDISLPLPTGPPIMPVWDPKVPLLLDAPDHWWMRIVGRLNAGVPQRQALARLEGIFKQTAEVAGFKPPRNERTARASLELVPGAFGIDQLRFNFSRPLLILMGMVVLVLLIACANVANLLLARATARRREIGIRLSMGASRGRLVRQLLTESIVLAAAGCAAGCALSVWGSRVLLALISPRNAPVSLDLSPDLRILGFTAATCILTGLLFGLGPAFRATRVDLTPALKRGVPAARKSMPRLGAGKTLVILQTALSVVLMFGAVLFVRTLVKLQNLNIGFDANNVLLFSINASQAGYKGAALNDFYSRVRARVAALPGVVSATGSFHRLLNGGARGSGIRVPGYTPKPGERMSVQVLPAAADFLKTMRIPLLLGRDLDERDTATSPKVAIVNETVVQRYFAGRNPIGQRIGWRDEKSDMEIVGVVADARYQSLRGETPAIVYHPFQQANGIRWLDFEVRTGGDPKALVASVRQVVASLDRNIPLYGVMTQKEQVDELLLQERLFAKLSSSFAVLALVLACIGLYGILSYGVARRTGEIGIRLALGAHRTDIMGMVLRETAVLVAAGLALAIPVSLGAGRLAASVISDLLYGLKSTDAASLAIAAVALIAAAALGCSLPARRASRVDPMTAIRYE